MRIIYLSRDFTTHDYRFLSSLAEAGFEVFFLRLERRGRQLEDRPLPPGVTLLPWGGGQGPLRWSSLPGLRSELRKIIRQVRPDVIHAGPIQSAAFLGALSGFHPLVSMSWGSDLLKDADSSRWNRWVTTFTLRRTDVLVGDCDAVRLKAISLGFPADQIYLFPWGIDLERFSPVESRTMEEPLSPEDGDANRITVQNLRSRLGWQDQFVVLSLRSWEPIYGVDVALRGFARAAQQAPELRLLMLGGGSLAAQVHQMIQNFNLGDRVYLGGQVSQKDLPRVYRSADLYLSASHSDGSSVSLMEALASARPVLVSDIPGNLEWVTSGEQGWLFADGDDLALADGILRALRQREELPDIGLKARQLAEERADWNKNFKVLVQAYDAGLRAGKGKLFHDV